MRREDGTWQKTPYRFQRTQARGWEPCACEPPHSTARDPSPSATPGEERAHKPPSVEKKHHFSLGPNVHRAEQGGLGVPRLPASPREAAVAVGAGKGSGPKGHEVSVGVPPGHGTAFLGCPERVEGGGEGVGEVERPRSRSPGRGEEIRVH